MYPYYNLDISHKKPYFLLFFMLDTTATPISWNTSCWKSTVLPFPRGLLPSKGWHFALCRWHMLMHKSCVVGRFLWQNVQL